MAIIKRYWVAALVMLLVMIHAMIIGYVRSESAILKSVASSEIPLGMFYIQSSDRNWLTQLRILLAVTPERREAAKATILHNRWLVHQTIEESLRELDREAFTDPEMTQLKDKIKQVLDESLREKIVERILICDRFDLPVEHNWNRNQRSSTQPTPGSEEPSSLDSSTLISAHANSTENTTAEDQTADDASSPTPSTESTTSESAEQSAADQPTDAHNPESADDSSSTNVAEK